jgi:hypothetical protein
MSKFTRFAVFLIVIIVVAITFKSFISAKLTGAPPNGVTEEEVPKDPFSWVYEWKRPEVPAKVALQVGHWKNGEVPSELENLKDNTGTSASGVTELEANLKIAEETARILEGLGINVEILPTTVPPRYWADAFIAIHADGSLDKTVNGYKVAPPWRDFSGKSVKLSNILEAEYAKKTNLNLDKNVTRNMRGYYAFNFWKYEHSLNPMTPSVILETGFLTNSKDRKIITSNPSLPADAISEAILIFLRNEKLI